jgi:hypothetical protein
MKNSSYIIGNRTCDLPACSAVPQLIAPPAACPTINNNNVYSIIITVYYRDIWDSSVSLVTRLRALRSRERIPAGTKDFYVFQNVQAESVGPHILPFNGYWSSFSRSKWLGRNTDHSPPSTVEVKNQSSNTASRPKCPQAADKTPLS